MTDSTVRWHPVASATVAVWRLQAVISVLVAIAVGATLIVTLAPGGTVAALAAVLAVLGLVALVLAVLWPALAHRRLRYHLGSHGLVIRQGVLWRHQGLLPRVRIQHSDVSQGPLQRHFGVATLKLYTAGSRFTETVLPGLDYDQALSLREQLSGEPDDAV